MTELTVSPAAAARQVILAFADDEHLMGQQHTEWIGVAPFLEEDLAFASIGQDELGHAALLYELLVDPDSELSEDMAIDEIAFFRDPPDWRSCALVEVALPDWGDTLVRHWLYDAAEEQRWELFAGSTVPALASAADRALSEERFHRRHADALLDVLLESPDARHRITGSLDRLLPLGLAMFDGVAAEAAAVAEGVVTAPLSSLLPEWKTRVDARFGPVDWGAVAPVAAPAPHGRTERHPDFAPMLARMLEVLDLDRSAVW